MEALNLGTVVVSVVAAITATFLAHYLTNMREEKVATRSSKYSALRIAVILEDYAQACATFAARWSDSAPQYGSMPPSNWQIPTLEEFPSDLLWERIPAEISSETLSLPSRLKNASNHIEVARGVLDEPGAFAICMQQSQAIGLDCLRLARGLRTEFDLPRIDVRALPWNHIEWLEERGYASPYSNRM